MDELNEIKLQQLKDKIELLKQGGTLKSQRRYLKNDLEGDSDDISNDYDKTTLLKEGGKAKIDIKEKNKGKFTQSAKAAGESVQEHAKNVVNNPESTTLQKKRAQFAINAKKWHH